MSWTEKDIEDLRDLQRALDAMDDKRLQCGEYVDREGVCCATAVLAIYRGISPEMLDAYSDDDDVVKEIGISDDLYSAILAANDILSLEESLEDRWRRMRYWVDRQLAESAC